VTVLLDSTILVDVLRLRADRVLLLESLVHRGNLLATSVINVAEVYAGMKPHEAGLTAAIFDDVEIHEVTETIAKRAGMLVNQAARKGRTLAVTDMIVAATALEYGFTVATDNRKHFEKIGVELLPLQ
jgi:predicted nucleic acid-binding protein